VKPNSAKIGYARNEAAEVSLRQIKKNLIDPTNHTKRERRVQYVTTHKIGLPDDKGNKNHKYSMVVINSIRSRKRQPRKLNDA